jgi:hypothetical protein
MNRLRRPLLVALSTLLIATPAVTSQAVEPRDRAASVAAFTHPGVLVDKAQLDFVRQQVQAGAQPQKAAYDAMKASGSASLSYSPKPRAVVECGSSSNPNYGCSDERNDAIAAYTQALLW